MNNLLLVSNGHAEDLAASTIGVRLKKSLPNLQISALPIVGLGQAYDKRGIKNLGIGKLLPSGGFAKEGFSYLFKDLSAGLLGQLFKQIKIMRQQSTTTNLVVCMGDIFLVALCGLFIRKPMIYIDGPNSVRIKKYYWIERVIMRLFCQTIVVQDQATADYLKENNLPGLYLGTWTMDYVNVTGEKFGLEENRIVIGLIPGTREEAYKNLLLILDVFELMAKEKSELIGLVALALDKTKLKNSLKTTNWQYHEDSPNKISNPAGATVLLAEGKFGDVCQRSSLIIGLAGIANEQAVGLGTPVIAFPGFGPQTTMRRWQEIHNITGDSMAIITGSPAELAQKTLAILANKEELSRMKQIGLASKKDRGAIDEIIKYIIHSKMVSC